MVTIEFERNRCGTTALKEKRKAAKNKAGNIVVTWVTTTDGGLPVEDDDEVEASPQGTPHACGSDEARSPIAICGTPFIKKEAERIRQAEAAKDKAGKKAIINVLTDHGCIPMQVDVNAAATTPRRSERVTRKPDRFTPPPNRVTKSNRSRKPNGKGSKQTGRVRNPLVINRIPRVAQDDNANQGGCLCGKVRYQFRGTIPVKLCHCVDCQKWSGSAFTSIIPVPRGTFQLLEGTESTDIGHHVSQIGDPVQQNRRFFCRFCGSSMWSWHQASPNVVNVKAGTCDDSGTREGRDASTPGRVRVDEQFFVGDRMAYLGPLVTTGVTVQHQQMI